MAKNSRLDTNIKQVNKYLNGLNKLNDKQLDELVWSATNTELNRLVEIHNTKPILDTGNMKDNWSISKKKKAHYILYNNTEYAIDVNYSFGSPHYMFVDTDINIYQKILPIILDRRMKVIIEKYNKMGGK